MAVEARRVHLFPSQIIANRDFIATKNTSATRFYTREAEDFIPLPMIATPDPILRPSRRHQKPRIVPEFFTVKSPVKADGASTSNSNAAAVSVPRNHRKRSRDAIGDDHSNGDRFPANHNHPRKMSKASPFLGHEAAIEIGRHQSEIQHTQSIDDSFVRKLKEKDAEIEKIAKLNRLLQQKVKSLAMENEIWRDLAETNEDDANTLRSNLELALARGFGDDDAESCCGSNDPLMEGADGDDAAAESRRGKLWYKACWLPGVPLGRHRKRAHKSVVVSC